MLIRYSLFLALLFPFFSCNNNKDDSGDPSGEDTLLISLPDSLAEENPVTTPQIIGKWQLTEMVSGGISITDLGTVTIEFQPDGEVVSVSDQVPEAVFLFREDGTYIYSDLWDAPIKIRSVSAKELVLEETIDGEEVRYQYIRR
ncbi:MAG: hypothetical protein R3C61_28880 [Bacteroidia bacterium]